jgi:hypothetical protein
MEGGGEFHEAETSMRNMQEGTTRAMKCVTAAQGQMKTATDSHRPIVTFAVGDYVLLSTADAAVPSATIRFSKLQQHWLGPFRVIRVADQQPKLYRLKIPADFGMHRLIP